MGQRSPGMPADTEKARRLFGGSRGGCGGCILHEGSMERARGRWRRGAGLGGAEEGPPSGMELSKGLSGTGGGKGLRVGE